MADENNFADMDRFNETFPDLKATPEEVGDLMEDIGADVQYINPTCVVEREYIFTIVGIQRLHDGSIGYRLLGSYDKAGFGRAAQVDQVTGVW